MTLSAGVANSTVADAIAGDVDALAQIVGAYHNDMARIAFVICGNADYAQDAVQAAWPKAWQKLGSIRDQQKLRPWLMAIAANEARQMMRRRIGRPVVEIEVADIAAAGSDPQSRASGLDLDAALRRLSPDDRAILALRHVGGYDATEIGHAMGMPAGTVRTRLARTVARLRKELGND
jgi:RNA polymerase sigma-70 factor (ECF subfamily)